MYQKLIIVGNLGKDPEMRYAPNGDAVTNLNVATNRKYTDKSGQLVKETTWFRVSVWGKQAEACNQYLKKGSLVLVEGRLQADKTTGGPRVYSRQDGTSGASFEMTASEVKFLVTDKDGAVTEHSLADNGQAASTEDSIPF
ncbi:single-stranded DNA-binding protein [Candidatus Kaiserbacteria bacterium]|nr:single-stranded DNA-binding protein [Candidatus Kaiserbacteria bacterium]